MMPLPSNLQAEKSVLACALANFDSANLVACSLSEEDFTDERYQVILQGIKTLYDEKKPINVSTLSTFLLDNNYLEKIGGTDTLQELFDSYFTSEGLQDNINILRDKTLVRKLIVSMNQLETDYNSHRIKTDEEFMSSVEDSVNTIVSTRRVEGSRNLKQIGADLLFNVNEARNRNSNLMGVDTGYPDLNKITLGFSKGEIIVVAARPGVGKTSLALNIGVNVAKKEKGPVLMFSLEMSDISLMTRIVSASSKITMRDIQTGKVNDNQFIQLEDGIKACSDIPFYVDQTPGAKINDIVVKIRKFQSQQPNLKLVIIDYLSLISPNKKYENLRVQVGDFSHTLKRLALELQIPILIVSQLSRSSDQRTSKRPMISDLRESGDVEQDADKVILLYRDDYYNDETSSANGENQPNNTNLPIPNSNQEPNEKVPSRFKQEKTESVVVEVNVAKNRNGETNTCYLLFSGMYSAYYSPTEDTIFDYKRLHKLS